LRAISVVPPLECRSANNILRSRRKWLALARHFSASTELYGLNPSAHVPEMKPEQKQAQAVTPQQEIAPQQ
jgi:hypothetical protein